MKSKRPASPKVLVGRAEQVAFPELGFDKVPARIDTGARTTSVWASDIKLEGGVLSFALFGKTSQFYTGEVISTKQYEEVVVASSTGATQQRYKVKLLIKLKGKKVRARVTLADRSAQVYPVLVGRNVLSGKFVVDVKQGQPLYHEERLRTQALRSTLAREE